MSDNYIHSKIEALILASPEPLAPRKITQVMEDLTPSQVARAVSELNERYVEVGTSFRIRQIAGGYQFHILPEYVGYVEELFTRRRKMRLTRAALETVAIVAYRQPITKVDIEHIRGVASDAVIHNLMEKGMVTITGRATTVGKPLQYGTTDAFLQFFGLNTLTDLPKMEEIEQLVAMAEETGQTEFEFAPASDGETPLKLNIADGTFDPRSRYEEDDFETDRPKSSDTSESSESGEEASSTGSDTYSEPGEDSADEEPVGADGPPYRTSDGD